MKSFRNIREYYAHIINMIGRSGYSNNWSGVKLKTTKNRRMGVIITLDKPMEFRDGATLDIYEKIELNDDGSVFRPYYAYHYEREDENTHTISGMIETPTP